MKHVQSDLRIRISQLSEGIHNYQLISHPTELDLAENFQESISIDASLEKTKRQLYLRASVSTKAKFQCDRCAVEFDFPIQSLYNICYTFDEKNSESFPDDELRTIHIGTPYLELVDDVRECIMLAVPMKLICKEECRGLCPHCGVNMNEKDCVCAEENTDSRWVHEPHGASAPFDVLRTLISNNKN